MSFLRPSDLNFETTFLHGINLKLQIFNDFGQILSGFWLILDGLSMDSVDFGRILDGFSMDSSTLRPDVLHFGLMFFYFGLMFYVS